MNTIFRGIALGLMFAATAPASAGSPEESRNKAVARRIYEDGLSRGVFDVPYTPGFVGHGGGKSTFTHEAGLNEARGWRSAFPDLQVVVDHVVAEDDMVAVRWTARGTNTGSGNGIGATGKQVQTSGTTLLRFEAGAIAEEWVAGDALGLLRQLDMLPPPGGASAPAPGGR